MAIAKRASEPEPEQIWSSNLPLQRIRIEGLVSTGEPGVFELAGVKPRVIDWAAVRRALGIEGPDGPDEDYLMDSISEQVWVFDIRRILAERCKPA